MLRDAPVHGTSPRKKQGGMSGVNTLVGGHKDVGVGLKPARACEGFVGAHCDAPLFVCPEGGQGTRGKATLQELLPAADPPFD